MFACLYQGMCDVSRKLGYALAIHGSLTSDLDLIACPWTAEAVDAEELKAALMSHIGACGYADLLRRQGLDEPEVKAVMSRKESRAANESEIKPHGRIAWNLYMDAGSKVDLSVMPKLF